MSDYDTPEVVIDGREFVPKDWHGLRAILRDVYPADIFTATSPDLGPRLVALLREIDAATEGRTP